MASWLRRKLRSLFRWGRRAGRRDDGRPDERARPRQKTTKPMSNEKFIESCLRAHNDYRKLHGVPPLKHTKALSAISQKWADHLAKNNKFEHSNNKQYKGEALGENIAMKWMSGGGNYSGEEPTAQWYNEISKYDFKRHSGNGTGHFTQVVWKGSKELGVGRAQGKDGKWIVVANYSPAGNFIGAHAENVFPPSGGKSAVGPSTSGQSRPVSGDKKTPIASSLGSGAKPSSRTTVVVPVQHASRTSTNSPQLLVFKPTSHPTSKTTTHTPEKFHSKTTMKTTVHSSEMTSSNMTSPGMTSCKKTTVITETHVDSSGKKTTVTRKVVSDNAGPDDWFKQGPTSSSNKGRMVIRTEKVIRH